MQQTTTIGTAVSDMLNNALAAVVSCEDEQFGFTPTPEYIDALHEVLPQLDGLDKQVVEMCINHLSVIRLIDVDPCYNGVFALVGSKFVSGNVNQVVLQHLNKCCDEVAACIRANIHGDAADELVNGIEMFVFDN